MFYCTTVHAYILHENVYLNNYKVKLGLVFDLVFKYWGIPDVGLLPCVKMDYNVNPRLTDWRLC